MIKFSSLCDLLEKVQSISCHDPPFSAKEHRDRVGAQTVLWFKSYRKAIDSLGPDEAAALLSALLPHRRKDRIYGLQCASLIKLLGRCLGLGASKRHDLARYKSPGNGDLAECLERILHTGGPPALPPVGLLEVDSFLQQVAERNRFSAPEIRSACDSSVEGAAEGKLKQLLHRSTPVEAKWVVRLILKDLSPVLLDDDLVLRQFHFLLPDLLRMHNDFRAACTLLNSIYQSYPSQPDPQSGVILRQTAAASLKPIPGLMITRSDFCKARSMKHCLQMTSGQKWLVDRKYDGEYCQIHVDLDNGPDWLKIYSKSGRDSTKDRLSLHNTIRKCLRIGSEKCQIKRQCILVGEMVPYSEKSSCILSFDNIRKHVTRAGVFLGGAQDSPVAPGEHLMIVFFDVLLLDNQDIINQSIEHRRTILSRVYKKIDGRAMSAESTLIDFGVLGSKRKLMQQFAASNALRHEGLVLKPCGVPYLSFTPASGATFAPRTIKLKKDYIAGLGDEADFAVVGASYSAQAAIKCPGLSLTWTHFHLGCIMNETDVERYQAVPVFKLVATIAMEHCIPVAILQQISAEGKFLAEQPPSAYTVQSDPRFSVDVFFRGPFVFEVLGSSYSKPSDAGYFMLRHPRVKKMHGDRTWQDCITFDQLQDAAQEALAVPIDSETRETLSCLTKLEASCKRKFSQMSCDTTPVSAASILTPRSKKRHRNTVGDDVVNLIHVDEVRSSPSLRPACLRRPPDRHCAKPPLPTPPTSSPLPRTTRKTRPARGNELVMAATAEVENAHIVAQRFGKVIGSKVGFLEGADLDRGLSKASNRRVYPLADITSRLQQSHGAGITTDLRNTGDMQVKVVDVQSRQTTARGADQYGTRTARAPLLQDVAGQATLRLEKISFFEDAVVHVDKYMSIEGRNIIRDLRRFGATVTEDIRYWDRDSYTYGPLSDTVSESQSFHELRKVVLVDCRNTKSLCAALKRILALNQGKFRERVEIYDYRLVDALSQAQRLQDACEQGWKQDHGIGVVKYDCLAGRSIFVPI